MEPENGNAGDKNMFALGKGMKLKNKKKFFLNMFEQVGRDWAGWGRERQIFCTIVCAHGRTL